MCRTIVFGAGGRAGRHCVTEALRRGHQVTAVVRNPEQHSDLTDLGAKIEIGDVSDPASVARLARSHDAAITTAVGLDLPAVDFYTSATTALVTGLSEASVPRLALVGIGTVLEVEPGLRLHDTPDFPAPYRDFSLGHLAQLEVLATAGPGLDWVVLAPPPAVLPEAAISARPYRTGGTKILPPVPTEDAGQPPFSYVDLAAALLDEIDNPRHHRELVAVDL